jgi:hypothetical protein
LSKALGVVALDELPAANEQTKVAAPNRGPVGMEYLGIIDDGEVVNQIEGE